MGVDSVLVGAVYDRARSVSRCRFLSYGGSSFGAQRVATVELMGVESVLVGAVYDRAYKEN